MTGRVCIVGLGPGPSHWITPEATATVEEASDIVGYRTYLSRIAPRAGQTLHASDNRQELARAQHALALAASGGKVAVVSSGDPGVFAMAAAVFEAVDLGPESLRALDIRVIPGVTALLAAAARIGAPIGNDFCAINLSNNLKPWSLIEHRIAHAAQAGFAIAFYNPASRARPWQLASAMGVLNRYRAPADLVVLARAVGRPDETVSVTTLAELDVSDVDMQTLVVVPPPDARRVDRPCGGAWVYAPRRVEAVS